MPKPFPALLLIVAMATSAPAAPLVLNEYSAVGSSKMLDDNGSDTHFGRVTGNGGDWFELVIITDKPDLRGHVFEWAELGENKAGSFTLTDDPFWQSLPAGTLLTFSESDKAAGGLDTDATLNPQKRDHWVNAHLGDHRLIRPGGENISVGNDDWVLTIKNREGHIVFGPVGEGAPTWGGDKINSREAAALHDQPTDKTTPASNYNSTTQSSCGSPNTWAMPDNKRVTQNLDALRKAAPPVSPAPPAPAAFTLSLETLATIDTPGLSQEIVAYSASQQLLFVTNPFWKTLDAFHIRSLDPPMIEPLPDSDDELPGIQGLWMPGEPTSVAVHPKLPIAFVVTLPRNPRETGRVRASDLRPESFGQYIVEQAVGMHPDSIAVAPDGRFAIIANEGEGDPNTPGTIGVLHLDNLTPDTRARNGEMPYTTIEGLDKLLETPVGMIEPEYVTFDPRSRFAAVTCQENDAVAIVDLTTATPTLAGAIWLPDGSEPDGVAVMDNVPGPEGKIGCLVATANEGRFDPYAVKWLGQSVSFTWVDPAAIKPHAVPDVTVPVEPMITGREGPRRRDPESIVLVRFKDRILAMVGIERGDFLLCIDVTDYTRPRFITKTKTGDRPEGIIAIPRGEDILLITGDEGDDDDFGPGTLTFLRLHTVNASASTK